MSEKYLHEMIDDIEVLIDEAKPARFSPGKITIEKDVLMTVIEELRKQIPGEIERSHKIILNKDAILEDARVKAQQTIDQAAKDAGELIDHNEIVEMAKMRADEIENHAKETARSVMHNANEEADQIRAGALRYVNEIMEDVQGYVVSVKEAQQSIFDQLLSALDSDLESIKTNAKNSFQESACLRQERERLKILSQMKNRAASRPLDKLNKNLTSRYFQKESLLFLHTLIVCAAAESPPKEVIMQRRIIL